MVTFCSTAKVPTPTGSPAAECSFQFIERAGGDLISPWGLDGWSKIGMA